MKEFVLVLGVLSIAIAFSIQHQPLPSYNVPASMDLARLSAIAFCGKQCVDSWTCGTGKTIPMLQTFYIEHPLTKAAGYVGYNSRTDQIVLSFRGTSNNLNWI
jgi:hypothetical protein